MTDLETKLAETLREARRYVMGESWVGADFAKMGKLITEALATYDAAKPKGACPDCVEDVCSNCYMRHIK